MLRPSTPGQKSRRFFSGPSSSNDAGAGSSGSPLTGAGRERMRLMQQAIQCEQAMMDFLSTSDTVLQATARSIAVAAAPKANLMLKFMH